MTQQLDGAPFPDSVADAAPADFAVLRSLKRELLEELRSHRQLGNPVAPEDLLPRWPTDPQADPDVASLLFEDFCQRQETGDQPSVREYQERFPQQADSLANLFQQQAVLRSVGLASKPSGLTLALPVVGDEIFHFRLRQELGRGAFARVFLAEEGELAGRPVVLKVSGITGNEPQTLAQLQHTHIVPIYSVHEDARAGLRAVCMPYFGGASLAHVLRPLWEQEPTPTHGAELVQKLAEVGSHYPQPTVTGEAPPESPAHQLLRTSSYLRASVWLVARLAEGLHHAHQRGVLHRDIKPSNILLGSDGQPMLLDFNLAQNLATDEAREAATLGGTMAYMAPEHLRAMASRDAALARLVGPRADLYSLGMVLFEMLAGNGPFQQSASYTLMPVLMEAMALERSRQVPSLRARRPDVPWSLESIVRKCLAPDPAQRYQQADHLAEDLQAFLDDQPLRHAPELSRAERLRKWMRRHPRLTSSGTVALAAAVLLMAGGAVLAGVHQHLSHTREELAGVEATQRRQTFETGTVRAQCLINTTSELQDLSLSALPGLDHLRQGMNMCESTLALYEVLDREDWQQHPAWQRLDEDEQRRLSEDTRELLLLLAWARVLEYDRQGASEKSPEARAEVLRQALALLDRAETIPGLEASAALWLDRGFYLLELQDPAGAEAAYRKARALKPASARDHYLLAAASMRNLAGQDRDAQLQATLTAVRELNEAVRRNGKHYWSWQQRGICHLKLGENALAAADFGVCIGLWPEYALGHLNLGIALERQGKRAEAIAAYSAALERDPNLLAARRNRGITLLEQGQCLEALSDLNQVQEAGLDDASLHVAQGAALEKLGRHAEADAAFAAAWLRAGSVSLELQLQFRCVYAFAVAKRLPDQARRAFLDVCEKDPQQIQALYGLAMLAADRGQLEEAIVWFTRALDVAPGNVDARRFRAVLLARRGLVREANEDINLCLGKEPRAGVTLYAAACVAAQAVKHSNPVMAGEATEQALAFLRRAFAEGYGRDKADTDPDLEPIRRNAEFRRLLEK